MVTHDEIEAIAARAADRAIEGLFVRLGVDTGDPLAMQQDFAFLRSWRTGVGAARHKGLVAFMTALIAGSIGWLASVFQHKM